LTFAALGSSIRLGALVDLSDALAFVAAIPNLLGLHLMAPLVRREPMAERRAGRRAARAQSTEKQG